MEGVPFNEITLQQLGLAAFIGPLASHEQRGSKADQLVYLAIWSLARDWIENGCDGPEYANANFGQRKLQWEIAIRIWRGMSSHQRFDVLNGAGRVGLVHWRRVYLRNANLWQELERFSIDRITLPYGGEGYGHHNTLGECEECGIGLAAWRNCQYCVRHSASSHPLSWCLACEQQDHIRAWDQTRCPAHGGEPILEAWPNVPEEDWDDDIEVMEVEEPQEQLIEVME